MGSGVGNRVESFLCVDVFEKTLVERTIGTGSEMLIGEVQLGSLWTRAP